MRRHARRISETKLFRACVGVEAVSAYVSSGVRHEPKPFRLRGWFVFLSPGRNLRCFGAGAVSAQHSRLQVSASRPKSFGARGYFRPNRDKDMPKANNEPNPFRLRG